MKQVESFDDGLEAKKPTFFENWVFGLNGLGTLWIFLIMLLINADVISRFLFNMPIDGVTEIVEVSIAGIVFLQLADAVRAGRLTRSDGLFNKLLERKPKIAHRMGIVFELCGIAFFLAILYGAIPTLIESYQRDYFTGSEGIFTISIWPIRLILCVSCITVVGVFIKFIENHLSALSKLSTVSEEATGAK